MPRTGRPTKEAEANSRLAMARRAKGLTREELATAVGVTREYIYQIETGRHRPGMKTALRLSDKLEVPLDFIVHDPVFRAGGHRDAASI